MRRLLFFSLLSASSALAEVSDVNIHLDPSVGTALDRPMLVLGAALKVDTTLFKALGPVAPQLELFGVSADNQSYLADGNAFGAGLGVRLRLFNDEKGYLWNPGTRRVGNVAGNLWADLHFTVSHGGLGVGFDAAAGYELSLIDGLSVSPFGKFQLFASGSALLTFGLGLTVGAPAHTPKDADYDGDSVLGDDDKCLDDAGPASNAGCPVLDADRDGIPNDKDQCRTEPEDKDGFEDEDGCPDVDNDQDGVLDGDDRCPLVKGVAENHGCPDSDQDEDTVVDRLDKCPDEKGDPKNAGCPWPDSDGDGTVDPFDNCPTEAGPADNQGCPVKVKQMVVITAEKLVIKDKVFFTFDKATIQRRSFGMLDQIASILLSHPDLKLVQVEGHTDSSGDAAYNRSLSQQRAEAVRDYLVKKGVAAERLRPLGFGPDKPQDTNDTAKGRENNRRVEFNIVDQ